MRRGAPVGHQRTVGAGGGSDLDAPRSYGCPVTAARRGRRAFAPHMGTCHGVRVPAMTLRDRITALEVATRPVPDDLRAALARRWDELPAHARTPSQVLGQHSSGCEGTHGVFPSCDLACTPCYHSREANRVRTDGEHTTREVDAPDGAAATSGAAQVSTRS